jgi:hypothetical protein
MAKRLVTLQGYLATAGLYQYGGDRNTSVPGLLDERHESRKNGS